MFENSDQYLTINAFAKGLDASTAREGIISENIANVNTPNYKKKSIIFEDDLKRAMFGPTPMAAQTTDPRQFKFKAEISFKDVRPFIHIETMTNNRNDRNNVDIDKEMADNAKNQIMFNAIATNLSDKFRVIKDVISKGAVR